jgi:hypothetical protein
VIKPLYDLNHNGLKTSGLAKWDGVPIPPTVDTGALVIERRTSARYPRR